MVQAGYSQAQADADVYTYAKELNFYVGNFLPRTFAAKIASFIDAMYAPASVTACDAAINNYLHHNQAVWDNFDFYEVRKKLYSIVSAITWTPV